MTLYLITGASSGACWWSAVEAPTMEEALEQERAKAIRADPRFNIRYESPAKWSAIALDGPIDSGWWHLERESQP